MTSTICDGAWRCLAGHMNRWMLRLRRNGTCCSADNARVFLEGDDLVAPQPSNTFDMHRPETPSVMAPCWTFQTMCVAALPHET